jgi:uncharacterized protein YbjT (DUF2867 family)
VLVRKPFTIHHPRLEVQQVIFNDINDFKNKLGVGDCIFCCIGTTQQKVKGDRTAYRKVDYDIPVNASQIGFEHGFTKYLLVSSVGANSSSKNFYLKLKGEVEDAITKIPFESIHIFQPSILLGKRNEFRLGEFLGKVVMQGLSFLLTGSLKKYRGIQAIDVARAMIAAAKKEQVGIKRYQYKEMIDLIK